MRIRGRFLSRGPHGTVNFSRQSRGKSRACTPRDFFLPLLSRMEEKTASYSLTPSSRSRALNFALLGGTLLSVSLAAIRYFDPTAAVVCKGPTMEDSGCNSNVSGVQSTHIPFFGSADDDTMSKSWSHLNHRVEEYRDDLVKVVEVSTRR